MAGPRMTGIRLLSAFACAVAVACAPRPPPPSYGAPQAETAACEQLMHQGDEAMAVPDFSAAVDRYQEARGRCVDPRPAGMKLASALSQGRQFDAAAAVLGELVVAPNPPLDAFLQLERVLPEVSTGTRVRLGQVGSSADAPVHVPSRTLEYSWVGAFACPEGHPEVSGQKELHGPNGQMDAVDFSCSDGAPHRLYFLPAH